ncbi:MAG TPA: E3 binding domain-containing protein [Conexibacter sp.]|nr:E3 binding domain-containing protein [Conexibacter sp.]
MAAPTTRARRRTSGAGNGRRASEKVEKYRFAQNLGGEGTVAEREYEAYALAGDGDPRGDPDVLLAIPVVKVDSIHLEVDDLDAHVALTARVLSLVRLNAGVDVHLGRLRIDIKGVEAQALLKVRLDHVTAIVDRVLTTVDRNPELVKSLGRTVEHVGEGAGHALGETGEAVESIGEGAEGAVKDVGSGAGEAVGEIGEGAGQAVGDVGEGASQAVGDVGEGAGQAVGDLGEGAGQALGELEGVVSGALQGEGGAGGGIGGASAKGIAKLAAKLVVHELRSAAADEAKGLGLAATRKAIEVGERRKQRKAEDRNATQAAMREAESLGVELQRIEGSGPEGRITIRDVREAQEE